MMRLTLCLCLVLIIFLANDNAFTDASGYLFFIKAEEKASINLSAMEALDLVKEKYAANFEKIYTQQAEEDKSDKGTAEDKSDKGSAEIEYYYKLPFAEYYLVYEGQGETSKDYLFHLYEFVLDEPDTGLGHFVTYGWYTVDCETGIITDETQ